MEAKLDDVWGCRDLPVLIEVTRRVDRGDLQPLMVDSLADELGFSVSEARAATRALERTGYIRVQWGLGGNGHVADVNAKAYFATGLHPDGDDLVTHLVNAALQAAELTDDPDERTRLRRFADGAIGVSRDVMSGVLTAVLTRGMSGV